MPRTRDGKQLPVPGRAVRETAPPARQLPIEVDGPTAARRLRAADYGRVDRRRVELTASIGTLYSSILRRRAEIAADDVALKKMIDELSAIERADLRRAQLLAPSPPSYLTMGEACRMAGRSENTMRKLIRQHGFGWVVDGRWRISQPDLAAYLAGLPN